VVKLVLEAIEDAIARGFVLLTSIRLSDEIRQLLLADEIR